MCKKFIVSKDIISLYKSKYKGLKSRYTDIKERRKCLLVELMSVLVVQILLVGTMIGTIYFPSPIHVRIILFICLVLLFEAILIRKIGISKRYEFYQDTFLEIKKLLEDSEKLLGFLENCEGQMITVNEVSLEKEKKLSTQFKSVNDNVHLTCSVIS